MSEEQENEAYRGYIKMSDTEEPIEEECEDSEEEPDNTNKFDEYNERRAKSRAENIKAQQESLPYAKNNKPESKRKGRLSAKSAGGKVSSLDKIKMLELAADGHTPVEISKIVNRNPLTVARIIEKLKRLSSKAFNQDLSNVAQNENINPTDYIDTQVYENVIRRLCSAGVDQAAARDRVTRVCKSAADDDIENVSEEDLYNAAMRIITGSELFISQTSSGKSGVSVLTLAAEQKAEGDIKNRAKSAKQKDRIFKLP